MKLIVGLGNPGTRYEKTRHNVGFMMTRLLSHRWNIATNQEKFRARFGEGEFAGDRLVLLQPLTYMNLSGQTVQSACAFYKIPLQDLLVISDDFALPLGRIRLRAEGSSGGHNGLADIERRLGTSEYPRLRFGIGRAGPDAVDYVLAPFESSESDLLTQTQQRAAEAVECWVIRGIDAAMSAYNRAEPDEPPAPAGPRHGETRNTTPDTRE